MLSSLTTSFSAEEAAFPQHGRFGHPHPELRTARRRTEGLNCSLNTTLVYSDIYIYCSPSVHIECFHCHIIYMIVISFFLIHRHKQRILQSFTLVLIQPQCCIVAITTATATLLKCGAAESSFVSYIAKMDVASFSGSLHRFWKRGQARTTKYNRKSLIRTCWDQEVFR